MIYLTLLSSFRIHRQSKTILSVIACTLLLMVSVTPGRLLADDKKFVVVTTTGIIADTVSKIGRDLVEVDAIMGEGVDPHLYKASPGDMKKLLGADLVLHNGLHLEGKMADALEKLASRKPVRAVTNSIPKNLLRSPNSSADAIDPHVWFAAPLWRFVIDEIAAILNAQLPGKEETIRANTKATQEEFTALDLWIHGQIQEIPSERRILITAHDAFSYYGSTYGIKVLAIQGMSTDSEASLQEINQLVETIVSLKIPAVFVESSVPKKTIMALVEGARSRMHEVIVGGELYSDALGAAGSEAGTLPGIIRHNTKTIVAALRGNSPIAK